MPDSPRPPTLEQVCSRALRLPCAPSLLPRLSLALQSNDSSAYEIEELIALDSSLAAATLRLANSAAFGRGGIDTLEGAVLRLGAKEIYRLAALVLVSRWENGVKVEQRWEPGDFSRHALCTAIAAEVLAEFTGRIPPSVAYTAGLVIDLGKLALAYTCADFYPAVRASCEKFGVNWAEGERKVFGFHHADVSARLLQEWKFPAGIVLAARHLPNPAGAPAEALPLLSHLHAAKYLALAFGPGAAAENFLVTVPAAFLAEWGFTRELLEQAMPVLLERANTRLGEKLTHGPIEI